MHEDHPNMDHPTQGGDPNARPGCLSNQAKPPAHQPESPPLCCPACGYNLTGICTDASPAGKCPECGKLFERSALLQLQRERASFNVPWLVLKLVFMPAMFAWLPMCCGCGMVAVMNDYTFLGNLPSLLAMASGPLVGSAIFGWMCAADYHKTVASAVPPENQRPFQRHIALPWLLFFLVEAILTGIYIFAGCSMM